MVAQKGSDYWQKRFQAVEDQANRTARQTVQAITPAFDQAQSQIEKEINAWYARFAKNNEISMQEAKRLLNTKELKEFKWDVESYIKYGRENAIDQAWMKELENASARYHISRLEALRIRTQNAAEQAFGNELDQIDQMAARLYTDDYYRTAYEIQRGLGIGFEVGQIDDRKLKNVLSKPWTADKMTFSDRVWKSKTQLIDSLQTELTQMCILGKDPQGAIDRIAKRMDVSKGQAGRLVMTEAAYFSSAAQKDCFNDLDVEKYEIVATLDSRTSEICQQMDGKVFDMKDFQIGVTAPPFHVWCRSCTCPWFEDFTETETRMARDADGKSYRVPGSMKYDDWKQCFVDKTKDPADFLKTVTVDDILKVGESLPSLSELLSECKTTSDVSSATQKYFRNKEGCRIQTVDFGKCEFNASKELAQKLDELDDEFHSGLKRVRVKYMSDSIGGMSTPTKESFQRFVDTGDPSVLEFDMDLNETFLKSKKAILNDFKVQHRSQYGGVASGAWIGEESATISTLVHEYGHTICPGKANEVYQSITGDFNPSYMPFRRMYNTYMRDLRDKQREIMRIRDQFAGKPDGLRLGIEAAKDAQAEYDAMCISNYSTSAVGEFIAEAFCDAVLNSNPKPASVKVHETIVKLYGKGDK